MEQVVKEVIPVEYFDGKTVVHINPCGLFIIGGPMVGAHNIREIEMGYDCWFRR